MPRQSAPQKLTAIRQKFREAEAALKAAEAADRKRQKADDHRRRLLLGRAIIEVFKRHPTPELRTMLQEVINSKIKRDTDRALFDDMLGMTQDRPAAEHETEPA